LSVRLSTKSDAEKEDESVRDMSRPLPKDKPPRRDKSNHKIKIDDPDLDTRDKDLSMNRKDIGGSASPMDSAICLISMRLRGLNPSLADVTAIRGVLARQGATNSDLTNARFYPVLAAATLGHIDRHYKHAKYVRIQPSSDGRRFEMGSPVLPRDPNDPRAPLSTKSKAIKPSMINEVDHDALVTAAKGLVDPILLQHRKDVALRNALDMAIHTLEDGKYDHMLDANTYLAVLNKLSGEDLDLAKETFVSADAEKDQPKLYDEIGDFDPMAYFGQPVVTEIDVHKQEAWKQHFEHAGPYEYNSDEPYMARFSNPNV